MKLALMLLLAMVQANGQVGVPQDVVKHLRSQATASFVLPTHPEEYAAIVRANGEVIYYANFGLRGGSFRAPEDTVLLLHTHPREGGIHPSQADEETAKRLGIPNCVVTRDEIWCALPNGKIERGFFVESK